MRARLSVLISLVVALFVAGNVRADSQFFDGDPADHLWTTEGNWDAGVPDDADWAKIRGGPDLPGATIVEAGAIASRVHIGYSQGGAMTVDGGTLAIVGDDLLLGKNEGSGTLDMISGSIDIARDFEVGGGNPGFVYMRGGTITVGDDLMIPEIAGTQAEVYLNGGTISLGGDLTMGETGILDITGGTLIIDGNEVAAVQGYIDSGWITAYDANGTVAVDYDVTNAGQTTVRGIHKLNPSPADGGIAPAGVVQLSWTLPDPCTPGQPVPVDVYFTDDYYALWNFSDPASIQVVDHSNVTSVNVTVTGQKQYYWAVDTYVGSATDPVYGPIFSFYVGNQAPTVEISADPAAAWLADGTGQASLDATVTDDATASPTLAWSVVSEPSPGAASIISPNAEDTVVTFTEIGLYTLQLAADDGEAVDNIGTGEITIEVFEDSCEAAQSLAGFDPIPGDVNADCEVDFLDFAILAAGWLECNALDCGQ